MRDISSRILRRPLARYAEPATTPRLRRLRWLVPALIVWAAWAGFLSDHSFWRLHRLAAERAEAEEQLATLKVAIDRIDADLGDAGERRRIAEEVAREKNGMARPGEIIYRVGVQGAPRVEAPRGRGDVPGRE